MGKKAKCTEPDLAALLPHLLAGRLASAADAPVRKRLVAHTKTCSACRAKMLDEANRSLTLPALKQVAKVRGVPMSVVCAAFRRYAMQKRNTS